MTVGDEQRTVIAIYKPSEPCLDVFQIRFCCCFALHYILSDLNELRIRFYLADICC